MSPEVNQVFGVTLQREFVSRSHLVLEKEDNNNHQPTVPTAHLHGGSTPVRSPQYLLLVISFSTMFYLFEYFSYKSQE